jgi:hypothetical protein
MELGKKTDVLLEPVTRVMIEVDIRGLARVRCNRQISAIELAAICSQIAALNAVQAHQQSKLVIEPNGAAEENNNAAGTLDSGNSAVS